MVEATITEGRRSKCQGCVGGSRNTRVGGTVVSAHLPLVGERGTSVCRDNQVGGDPDTHTDVGGLRGDGWGDQALRNTKG